MASAARAQRPHQPPQLLPDWLPALLGTRFYGACRAHASLRRNELNLFDTVAVRKICQHCQPASQAAAAPASPATATIADDDAGAPPALLHISRYMYHDVVLLREAAAWFDVAHIQAYLNNGHRVLYLDRSQQQKSRLAPNAASCKVCDRTLQHPYLFCSLRCKLFPNLVTGDGKDDDDHEGAGDETCPNTPQSSVGSVAPGSPGCLLLPPANKRAAPSVSAALEKLLSATSSTTHAKGLVSTTGIPTHHYNHGRKASLPISKKGQQGGASSAQPKTSSPAMGMAAGVVRGCTTHRKGESSRDLIARAHTLPVASSDSASAPLASDIRKNKRKGRPMHSPAAGPKTFMLLRQTLQPLLL